MKIAMPTEVGDINARVEARLQHALIRGRHYGPAINHDLDGLSGDVVRG
jgi:hypothetical protein